MGEALRVEIGHLRSIISALKSGPRKARRSRRSSAQPTQSSSRSSLGSTQTRGTIEATSSDEGGCIASDGAPPSSWSSGSEDRAFEVTDTAPRHVAAGHDVWDSDTSSDVSHDPW